MTNSQLADIAFFVRDTVRSDTISLGDYVTTDCLLQNKEGRKVAENLPPQVASLISYKRGDVLIANIRPYLRKIWFADCDGGASHDVLVLRAKDGISSEYLYSLLLQDGFFNHVMKAAKGAKMPRGDEGHIMRFPIVPLDAFDQRKIGKFFSSIDRLIQLSRKRIVELEKMAKEIYDYWFVQFDFSDKNGKPYKSSGGKMVYNPQLKRNIPEGWEVRRFGDFVSIGEEQVNPQKLSDIVLEHYSIPAFDDGRYPSFEVASTILSNKFKVVEGSFLVSKLNPQFQRVWDPLGLSDSPICSTEFIVCKCDGAMRPLLFEIAKSIAFQNFMVQRSSSSTGSRKRIDPQEILSFDFTMPSGNANSIECFNRIVSGFLGMIRESRKMIKQLTTLREFLLPLLMNGQAKMN